MICKHFGKCGGCYYSIDYKEELEEKRRMVEELFEIEVEKIIPSPKVFFYRNRIDLTCHRGKIGFRERGKWYKVINIEECLLFSESLPKYLKFLRSFFEDEDFYDIVKKEGFLRYIVLREAKFIDSKMVIFVTTSKKNLSLEPFLEIFSSAVWEINDTLSDVSFGEVKEIAGERFWREKILDFEFLVHPLSFFQTNSYAAQELYRIVKDICEGKILIDAYCGVGCFSLILSENFEKIIGIEVQKESVECAKLNAERNDVKNVDFVCGEVEKNLWKFDADVVLLDPPRSGLHPRAIRILRERKPKKIVYVSCNPKTQKRDFEMLEDLYEITLIQPIDMFPRTNHVENIIVLELR